MKIPDIGKYRYMGDIEKRGPIWTIFRHHTCIPLQNTKNIEF